MLELTCLQIAVYIIHYHIMRHQTTTNEKDLRMKASTLKTNVNHLNELLAELKRRDCYAIEPDSTWESVYEIKPIVLNDRFIYFGTIEIYSNPMNKVEKLRFNLNNPEHEEDIRYFLRWTRRAINKGLRS